MNRRAFLLGSAAALLILLAPLVAAIPVGACRFLPESDLERLLRSARYRLAVALVPLVIVAVAAKSDFDTRLGRLLGGLPSPPGPAAAQASPDAEPFSDLRRPDSASHRGRS